MTSNGWRSLLNDDWADCVLHNLPNFVKEEIIKKPETISISGYQESAATWNWFDFQEKMSRIKNVGGR